ncbi:uncharacterized protein LOC121380857 isoform X2 [Gigantopelta aegis]|nr:uncharacterized protein LOC121380857 isoform X2 [Gigantopelta aegis]
MEPGVQGRRTTLKCTGIHPESDGAMLLLPNNAIAGYCRFTSITSVCKGIGRYDVEKGPNREVTLIINSFDQATDVGEWKCASNTDIKNEHASCFKRAVASVPGKSGACTHGASTSVVIFWTIVILAANLQLTTSMFFN